VRQRPGPVRGHHDERFGRLLGARRVWAVGAVHGDAARLIRLHDALKSRFRVGDRLVYLGNYLGRGGRVVDTVDELLQFRSGLLGWGSMFPCDIVYLRGHQEEMWNKLLQIHLAPNPDEVIEWMIGQGVDATLAAYGTDGNTLRIRCREGTLALARWTADMRQAIRARPGHDELLSALKRAAFSEDGTLLFVHAGVDTSRPLSAQSDTFWWGSSSFSRIGGPYGSFRRIVRGYDNAHGGVQIGDITATIDAGCGFGGDLAAACFDHEGELADLVEV